ncbi:MAG TPA: YihY/virulence factor BrkB family protein [Terracidiphilus sp.]|nr:YihY/virulence factor BrkB family protein [Terracidiphilus sp.]
MADTSGVFSQSDRMLYSGMGTCMTSFSAKLRKAVLLALEHDVINTAKATAFSGMLMLFPALVVLTAMLALVPEGTNLVGEIRRTFEVILPSDTMRLLATQLETRRLLSAQLLISAVSLSLFAALGVMLSLMEGFRRAYRLPRNDWGFWQRRLRALMLVPIVLVPLALATLVLMLGRPIETWMISTANHELKLLVLMVWRLVRWTVALITSVAVLGALYHFGTKRGEHWLRVMPGAVASTLAWFPSTLAFGWYVTRVAHYSRFYGSFGAGIATLVWLYITSFAALLGAELNGVLFRARNNAAPGEPEMVRSEAPLSRD